MFRCLYGYIQSLLDKGWCVGQLKMHCIHQARMTSKAYFEHIHQARRRSQSNSFLGYMNPPAMMKKKMQPTKHCACLLLIISRYIVIMQILSLWRAFHTTSCGYNSNYLMFRSCLWWQPLSGIWMQERQKVFMLTATFLPNAWHSLFKNSFFQQFFQSKWLFWFPLDPGKSIYCRQ